MRVAQTTVCATTRQPLDLMGLTVAKLYCVMFWNGDRFEQQELQTISAKACPGPSGMPNIVDGSTPFNSESDSLTLAIVLRRRVQA